MPLALGHNQKRQPVVADGLFSLLVVAIDGEDEKVIAFDFRDKVFRMTPLLFAKILSGRNTVDRRLMVLNGYVALGASLSERFFELWILFEFGVMESWTRMISIPSFEGTLLGLWNSRELIIRDSNSQLVLYDFLTLDSWHL